MERLTKGEIVFKGFVTFLAYMTLPLTIISTMFISVYYSIHGWLWFTGIETGFKAFIDVYAIIGTVLLISVDIPVAIFVGIMHFLMYKNHKNKLFKEYTIEYYIHNKIFIACCVSSILIVIFKLISIV